MANSDVVAGVSGHANNMTTEFFESPTCVVCMDSVPDCVCMPCRHKCLCNAASCAQVLLDRSALVAAYQILCPICRNPCIIRDLANNVVLKKTKEMQAQLLSEARQRTNLMRVVITCIVFMAILFTLASVLYFIVAQQYDRQETVCHIVSECVDRRYVCPIIIKDCNTKVSADTVSCRKVQKNFKDVKPDDCDARPGVPRPDFCPPLDDTGVKCNNGVSCCSRECLDANCDRFICYSPVLANQEAFVQCHFQYAEHVFVSYETSINTKTYEGSFLFSFSDNEDDVLQAISHRNGRLQCFYFKENPDHVTLEAPISNTVAFVFSYLFFALGVIAFVYTFAIGFELLNCCGCVRPRQIAPI